MSTILVTGGAGFIGSCFVRMQLANGADRIVNLDKLTYAGHPCTLESWIDDPRHVFVVGDVSCRQTVDELLSRYRPQSVVHFAAETHVDRSIDGPAAFIETNIVGTANLLDGVSSYWGRLPAAEATSFRFLHVSTDEVYGSASPGQRFSEQSAYAPNSPYAASKAAADHLVRAYHRTYGLPTLTTHCANNYGPYQFPEKLIPHMIRAAVDGRPLPIYGDGSQEREWLHVEDHCQALDLVLNRGIPGKVYHIGSGEIRSNRTMVNLLCDLVDELRPNLPHAPCRSLQIFVADRPGHDTRYALNSDRIRSLGWAPHWTLEEGLVQTVDWYLSHEQWANHAYRGAYQGQRLGLGRNAVISARSGV